MNKMKRWLRNLIIILVIFSIIEVVFFSIDYFTESNIKQYSIEHNSDIEKTAKYIVNNSIGEEAIAKILTWMVNSSNFRYNTANCARGNIRENSYPEWILANKCGGCGEAASLFSDLANSVNITTREIYNPGENHDWDEVLINGSWIIINPLGDYPAGFNKSKSFREDEGVNVSFVYTKDSNGNIIDVTKTYTDTGKLIVYVKDSKDSPLPNSTVVVLSHSLIDRKETIFPQESTRCYTNSTGICPFEIGENNYTIIAEIGNIIKLTASKTIKLNENQTTEITLYPAMPDLIRSIPGTNPLLDFLNHLLLFLLSVSIFLIFLILLDVNNRFRKLKKAKKK